MPTTVQYRLEKLRHRALSSGIAKDTLERLNVLGTEGLTRTTGTHCQMNLEEPQDPSMVLSTCAILLSL
jgi:hypothetical protein